MKARSGKIYRFSKLVVAAREQPITEPQMWVAAAATKLVLKLKLAVAWAIFCFLRWCERLVPTSLLSLLLWPPAGLLRLGPRSPAHAADLLESLSRVLAAQALAFRPPTESRPLSFATSLPLAGSPLHHALAEPMPLEGGSDLIGSRQGDRGVVLASLHYGPSEILPYWLRAHGIVTTLIGASPVPDSLESVMSYQFALSPPARRADVSLCERDVPAAPLFAHRAFPGTGPPAACDDRCGPRDTISCGARKSLVPNGDRSDPPGSDGRR